MVWHIDALNDGADRADVHLCSCYWPFSIIHLEMCKLQGPCCSSRRLQTDVHRHVHLEALAVHQNVRGERLHICPEQAPRPAWTHMQVLMTQKRRAAKQECYYGTSAQLSSAYRTALLMSLLTPMSTPLAITKAAAHCMASSRGASGHLNRLLSCFSFAASPAGRDKPLAIVATMTSNCSMHAASRQACTPVAQPQNVSASL